MTHFNLTEAQIFNKIQEMTKPQRLYRHFKGKMYRVLSIAKSTDNTGTISVVYQQAHPPYEVYYREYNEFMSDIDPKREGNITGQNKRMIPIDVEY